MDGTRSTTAKSNAYLYPHQIITYPPTRTRKKKTPNNSPVQNMPTTPKNSTSMDNYSTNNTSTNDAVVEITSMDLRQLHSSQQEAMKKIVEFNGEPNELDIDEWLYDLTNLFSLMKLKDETKILETMGKLTGPALRWYQENLTSFDNWKSAEKALRNRFKTFTSDSQLMQEFFQLRQEKNQSITSFYENVLRKYRISKGLITEQQLITVLQTGVKRTLKEYLIRNEEVITKPEEWLNIAREEEYIQQRIQQQRHASPPATTSKPYFESTLPTAAIHYKSSTNIPSNHRIYKPRSYLHNPSYDGENNQPNHQQTFLGNTTQTARTCQICNRTNHSTIKCFFKKKNGCFKCGQSTHRLRDCPQRHFFE